MSDLLKRLKSTVSTLETWGNLADAKAVEQAEARIRELEAELESKSRHLKNATTLRDSDFNELWREIKERDEKLAERDELLNGVTKGTHCIVPVEPTVQMLADGVYSLIVSGLDGIDGVGEEDAKRVYRAMIRAAQENADDVD